MKKIVVGKQPTKGKMFLMMCVCAILAILFSNFLCTTLQRSEFLLPVFFFFLIVMILLYVPTFVGSYTYWVVDDNELSYYASSKHTHEIAYTFAILCNKKQTYTTKVNLQDIKKIDIYWTSQLYIWATKAYPIMLRIKMKDDTFICFEALYDDCATFAKAIKYLQATHHILINDPFHLLPIIQDSNKNLYQYINSISNATRGEDKHA